MLLHSLTSYLLLGIVCLDQLMSACRSHTYLITIKPKRKNYSFTFLAKHGICPRSLNYIILYFFSLPGFQCKMKPVSKVRLLSVLSGIWHPKRLCHSELCKTQSLVVTLPMTRKSKLLDLYLIKFILISKNTKYFIKIREVYKLCLRIVSCYIKLLPIFPIDGMK